MSNLVSPAQVLPPHILHRIIEYSGVKANKNVIQILPGRHTDKTMLSVCSSWRLAALDYSWNYLQIMVRDEITLEVIRPKNFNQLNLPLNVSKFVRKLSILVSLQEIANGAAYDLLLEYMGDTTCLSVASKCVITITDCGYDSDYSEDYDLIYIHEFSQLLISLIPAVASTSVCWAIEYMELDPFVEKCFGTFISLTCSKSKHVYLDVEEVQFYHMSTIDLIPQVSSLNINCKDAFDVPTNLLHKCANTLVDLDLTVCNATTLFYDANNNVVVYPYLEKLTLSATGRNDSTEQLSVPNIVTLPSLKDLNMRTTYPYTDDVLFRGNSATLRRLAIVIDQSSAKVLSETLALENKYKNLTVTITREVFNHKLSLGSDAVSNKVIEALAKAAHTFTLKDEISFNCFIAAAPPTQGFESLQVFNASSTSIALYDMLRLLKVLLNVVKISCGIYLLGPELENIAIEKRPDHVASTYCAVGRNLQIVSNVWIRGEGFPATPEYVLLLALACPKLCRVNLHPTTIDYFQTNVAEMLQSGPYSKYASQLNCMLHAAY